MQHPNYKTTYDDEMKALWAIPLVIVGFFIIWNVSSYTCSNWDILCGTVDAQNPVGQGPID